jgi:hypothetical protein
VHPNRLEAAAIGDVAILEVCFGNEVADEVIVRAILSGYYE